MKLTLMISDGVKDLDSGQYDFDDFDDFDDFQ